MLIFRLMQGNKEIATGTFENITMKKDELQNKYPKRKYNVEKGFIFGENVWDLPEYEFRALRYAEYYGIIEYKVENNIMSYSETFPHEGTFTHCVNLETMCEMF